MRVAYWTTACLEPRIEAVSKEVFDLATCFSDSRVFSVSSHVSLAFNRRARAVGVSPRFGTLLRGVVPVIERAAAINHIYAEVNPWLFFKSLRRRPIVLTIASEKGDPVMEFLARCKIVVAQTEGMKSRLVKWGVEPCRVRLIYPGIDLRHFSMREKWRPLKRARVLFATFPRATQELDARGVNFLIDTATKCSNIDFTFVCRPWKGGSAARLAVEREIDGRGLKNITLLDGVQESMAVLYRSHEFTVIPYTSPIGGKECPRSLIESLACGVPVLISRVAPFEAFISQYDCGRVFECTAEGFARAIDQAMGAYGTLSANAGRVANECFDLRGTLRRYGEIYDDLA